MAEEVSLAGVVLGEGHGLRHVVEKSRPPERGRGHAPGELLDRHADARRVLEHVVGVVRAVLVEAGHGRELRYGLAQDLRLVHEGPSHASRAHDAVQLLPYALARDVLQAVRALKKRPLRLGLYVEAQAAREAHRPQHAQRVFLEAPARVAHGANETASQVAATVERVQDPALRMVGDGVYGKVPARQV